MIYKEKPRPICVRCNSNLCVPNGISKKGFLKYQKYCSSCNKAIYNVAVNGRKVGYRLFKKPHCELCGFVPINPCQLDVDHIDGNRTNNEESNLQTLCANCHRLKTYQQRIEER